MGLQDRICGALVAMDGGGKFQGTLKRDGRNESILMSMPPLAKWVYQHKIEQESIYVRNVEKGVQLVERVTVM